LIEACCDLLLLVAPLIKDHPMSRHFDPLPPRGRMDLLGCEPMRHIYHVCNVVFGTTPSGGRKDVRSAYSTLVDTFKTTIGTKIYCTCPAEITCDITKGWGETVVKRTSVFQRKNCLYRALWRNVGSALAQGFRCLLIEAQENVTLSYDVNQFGSGVVFGIREIESVFTVRPPQHDYVLRCYDIHESLMTLGGRRKWGIDDLAFSDGSCTIFPAALLRLQTDIDRGYRYNLCDGKLLIKGRYYASLRSIPARDRPAAQTSLFNYKGRIKPSSIGEHSRVSLTVREALEHLELRTTVLSQGHSIHLDLVRIIRSSMGLSDCSPCEHDLSAELDATLQNDVLTTSIAMPHAKGQKIAIVQTKDNATAQLLACGNGKTMILQRKCCLSCAVAQAKAGRFEQIIVAS